MADQQRSTSSSSVALAAAPLLAPGPLLDLPTGIAESSQLAQAGLAAYVIREALSVFASIDKIDDAAIGRLAALYAAMAAKYSPASAVLAMRQYAAQRLEEGIRDGFKPQPVLVPHLAPVRVEWAIVNAIGPDGIDGQTVQQSLAESLARTVQDAGRQTIIGNVRRDRVATAWARIPEPELTKTGTCAFCAMLCSRGAVYKRDTADFRSHLPRGGQGHVCVCSAAPVFGKYKPSDQVKRFQELWQSAVTDQGRHGRDARAAFRQAVEGRDVTGLNGTRSEAQMKPLKARDRAAPRDASPDEAGIRRQISELKQSNLRVANGEITGDEATKLRFANNKRIDALTALLS